MSLDVISLRPNEAIVVFSARLCLMLPNSFSSHEVRMVGLICSIIIIIIIVVVDADNKPLMPAVG